jgi:transposase InsO family protein
MKNQILLENYYLPGQLEQRLAEFVDYYNLRRYHESLNNLTPADVYFGRGQTILSLTKPGISWKRLRRREGRKEKPLSPESPRQSIWRWTTRSLAVRSYGNWVIRSGS